LGIFVSEIVDPTAMFELHQISHFDMMFVIGTEDADTVAMLAQLKRALFGVVLVAILSSRPGVASARGLITMDDAASEDEFNAAVGRAARKARAQKECAHPFSPQSRLLPTDCRHSLDRLRTSVLQCADMVHLPITFKDMRDEDSCPCGPEHGISLPRTHLHLEG
jgi:hypothetical protein